MTTADRAPGRSAWQVPHSSQIARETGSAVCKAGKPFDLDAFAAAVRVAARQGKEREASRLAIRYGQKDPGTLTNLIFFSRHPERKGCRLTRGEPRFSALSREWLDIQTRIVRPELKNVTSPSLEPPGRTLYVAIPLGGEGGAKPITGIFLPEHYAPKSRFDLILYLHGWKTPCGGEPGWAIDSMWRSRYFRLREKLNESRRNVILVAPTLGAQSQAGTLTHARGLDRYLDRVLAALTSEYPFKAAARQPGIGNIILAGHSGAGKPMAEIVSAKGNRYAANVRECWGFDSLYGDDDPWAKWARSRPDAKLYLYYHARACPKKPCPAPLKPEVNSKRLASRKIPNIIVEGTSVTHCWVPLVYWKARIAGANFLQPKAASGAS